mmetsp:Transcript_19415/g.27445  ORF Transcript_19415/g.27445 Transcript_19415/m.27445 type:complete len:654 (+) Transcript_19415:248-2209(+)
MLSGIRSAGVGDRFKQWIETQKETFNNDQGTKHSEWAKEQQARLKSLIQPQQERLRKAVENNAAAQIIMGCMSSKPNFIEDAEGDEEAFHKQFLEDRVLGEGQFGIVKMVHDVRDPTGQPLACKTLRKGVTFKDNTLYSPLKPEVLQQECDILRSLGGKHYCLGLIGIYETPKFIYMVTEFCSGGEMMEYVSKQTELRTEDVSRIAFQLLDAVNHCDEHKVIHRDIKPENIMFSTEKPGADLRLIDFGSGCIDNNQTEANLEMHTTFAGSAFYISPEMFQHTYTSKTDVWSVGAALYVLVAGYPADQLQKAFNTLQKSKDRNLRELPNLPEDMPDSYYDMLDELMKYRHKNRKSAKEMLQHEFVQFHKDHAAEDGGAISIDDIAAMAAAGDNKSPAGSMKNGSMSRMSRTSSIKIIGSVHRHAQFLGYQKFERSVTTLLATLLSKSEFVELLKKLKEYIKSSGDESVPSVETALADNAEKKDDVKIQSNEHKLSVIPMNELKAMLKDLGHERALSLIEKLPNSETYETFAYHAALLRQFAPSRTEMVANGGGGSNGSTGGSKKNRALNRNMSIAGDHFPENMPTNIDDSWHSAKSDGSKNKQNSSVHGNNIYNQWKSGKFSNPRKPKVKKAMSSLGFGSGNGDTLNNSWHHGS